MINACNGCGKQLLHKEKVVILMKDVEVSVNPQDDNELRLKLSEGATNTRATLLFCLKCLPLKDFGV